MTERDLPTVADLAGAIPDAAPSVGQEMAALRADLASCRARLAALVEADDAVQRVNGHGVTATEAMRRYERRREAWADARDYLAAHPAEGGRDG